MERLNKNGSSIMNCEKKGEIDVIRASVAEVKDDVKSIKGNIFEMSKELSRYNATLEDHTKRSTRLEKVIEKVEERSYSLSVKFYTTLGAVGVIQAIVLYLIKTV